MYMLQRDLEKMAKVVADTVSHVDV